MEGVFTPAPPLLPFLLAHSFLVDVFVDLSLIAGEETSEMFAVGYAAPSSVIVIVVGSRNRRSLCTTHGLGSCEAMSVTAMVM